MATGPSRAASLVLSALALAGVAAQSPSPATNAVDRFEAASVRRNNTDSGSFSAGFQRGGRFVAVHAPAVMLVMSAYPYEDYRIFSAPAWANAEYYDVVAVANAEVLSQPGSGPRLRQMLRNMLAERFGLVVHVEKRSLPMYALVRAGRDDRLGPSLRRSTVDCKAFRASGRSSPPPETVADFENVPTCSTRGGSGLLAAGGITMAEFADELRQTLRSSVVNRTGLEGTFDVKLRWNEDPSADANELPVLSAAVQEQLGLKLERRTEPVEVLVIDRIHRPDDN